MSTQISIRIDDSAWRAGLPDARKVCRRAAKAALKDADTAQRVALLLTGDTEMQRLNNLWRNIGRPTNVLAFEALGQEYAGDVALGYNAIEKEAHSTGLSLADHTAHLVVHGVLHLLGYDHDTDARAEKMQAAEIRVLQKIGIPTPYPNVIA